MRRLSGLLLSTLLAGLLLIPAAVPVAAAPDPATLVLAAAAEEGAEPPGPEPMGANATENPAAPPEYEANFLWGAGAGLLVITVLTIAGLGALYFVLVVRPRRTESESR